MPDILANAGGVIVSYLEYVQDNQSYFWDEGAVFKDMQRFMVRTFDEVDYMAEKRQLDMRTAALLVAINRIGAAVVTRGIFP